VGDERAALEKVGESPTLHANVPPHVVTVVLAAAVFASTAAAQSLGRYKLTRSSVEPGGVVFGGEYVARGTIGQPDAQTVTGGDYALRGGFWGAPEVPRIPTVSGWGVIVLGLLLLTAAKIYFGRRRRPVAG